MRNLWITLAVIAVVAAIATLVQGVRARMATEKVTAGTAVILGKEYFPFSGNYTKKLFAGDSTRAMACQRIGSGPDCIYNGFAVPCTECTKYGKPIV